MKSDSVRSIVFSVLRRQWRIVSLLMIAIISVVLISLIPPQLLRRVIDQHLIAQETAGLLNLGILYLFVLVSIGLFDFLKGVILTLLGQKITREIRSVMMKKAEKINARYYTANGTGATVSRFTNDVASIDTLFTAGLIGMVIDCFKIVGIIVSIALFNGWLGFIAVFLLPVIYGVTRHFQKRMLKSQIENRVQVGKVNNLLTESLKNVQIIKASHKESYSETLFTDALVANYHTVETIHWNDSLFPPLIQTMRAILIGGIVLLSASNLAWLGISVGMIAAAIELFSDLFAPLENVGMELQSIQQSVSGIRRVDAFLQETEDNILPLEGQLLGILLSKEALHLQFEHVTFAYEEGTTVLHDLDFSIHPLEIVTFIGRTGVGKTTLFKLCMGLLKPTQGRITINGMDVCQIPHSEKRKLFGYVDQGFPLVKGTICDQISLLDPAIEREQVLRALEFVEMKETILDFPQGIDTPVVNDTLFSQGQKQLLAIARAIVTDPPLLLLDEITANLDSITEQKIHNVLHKATHSHTILSISHRLTSMLECDTIVVLEEGRIKAFGTPDELLATNDWYKTHILLESLTWD